MKTIKKLLPIITWSIIGFVIFLLLQFYFEFHFYYAEQLHLFLYNTTFLSKLFLTFGGLSDIIGKWLLQFFIQPKLGAAITTFLFLSVAILMNRITKKINANIPLILLPLLAAIFIVLLHLNLNYNITGTIAFILALIAFLLYLHISKPIAKIIVASILAILLFWWGGSVAFLFTIAVVVKELLTERKNALYLLIPLCLVIVLAYISINLAWVGEYKQLFLPSQYFYSNFTPPSIIYFPWVIFLLLILFSYALKDKKISKKNGYIISFVQIIIAGVITYYLLPIYGQFASAQYMKLDYYTRMERWNDIIEEGRKPIYNLLSASYLNLALMETNQLGKQFLEFDQKGIEGLTPTWTEGIPSLIASNELNFSLGEIAASQHFTFEGNVTISSTGSPRLYKRLIQTNLINGAYPIAEKYIKLLEQTLYYQEWATTQRRFLFNDEAVESDPLLGRKRRGIPTQNYLLSTDMISRLNLLAEADPTNTTVIEYMASVFLFGKQSTSFMELIDKYYNTEEALRNMPVKFQEAIIYINRNNPAEWERYKINPLIIQKFREYTQMALKNKNNPNLTSLLYQNYGNTYWSYFIFSNN